VLDDVAVGPFLEQPARKDAVPLVVALFLHRQLDKGTGFGRRFPWWSRLARPQADDGAADARAVPRAHFQIADKAVAFVEQRHDRHALGHRRCPGCCARLPGDSVSAFDFGFDLGRYRSAVGRLVARRQQQRSPANAKRAHHQLPGCQAS
jgi:hypothetical protein